MRERLIQDDARVEASLEDLSAFRSYAEAVLAFL